MPNFRFFLFALLLNLASIYYSTSLVIELQNQHYSSHQGQNDPAISTSEPDIIRLTEDIKPISYELWVKPDLDNFLFSGTVKINIRTKVHTDQIILHSKKLKINKVRVLLTNAKTDIDNSYQLDQSNDLLIIKTSGRLNREMDYKIIIDFQGVLEENSGGFYRTYYTIGEEERWLGMTQFEPNHAREAFPCFDDPRFRSPFTIYIARLKKDGFAFSNMRTQDTLPPDSVTGPNYVWDVFRSSTPMPTNLVSYAIVPNFSYLVTDGGDMRIVKRHTSNKVSYIYNKSPKIYRHFVKYTNTEHYLSKLDIVVVPYVANGKGGAGNWGMVNVEERFAIFNEDKCSAQQVQMALQLISSKFSHQWFGDLVAPAWYDNEWLKEGFGSYFATFIADMVEPTFDLDQLFVVETIQESLWHEVTVQRAMTTPIRKPSQVTNVFDIISDKKAGSIIRMFELIVSPITFKKALHDFLQNGHEKQNGLVVENNLLGALDAVSSHETTKLPPHISTYDAMKTWTNNIGFPLITVTRNKAEGKVTVTQTSYRALEAPSRLPDQQWIVPLTYATKSQAIFSNTQPMTWLTTSEPMQLEERVLNTDWILFNVQHSGYYRVSYDTENWHLLIDQLQRDHKKIHVLNRAQLIDDAFALAYDEHLSYAVALKLADYLPKETEMIPWYAAIKAFNRLRLKLKDSPNYEFFQTYLRNLVKNSIKIFDFSMTLKNDHIERIVKPKFLMLACEMGNEYCIENSLNEYNSHKDNLVNAQPDLKDVVFCHALINSKDQQTVFGNLWDEYTKSKIPFEKTQILTALSCASDEGVIRNVLAKMTNPNNREIQKQDRSYFLTALATRIFGITAALRFTIGETETINRMDDGITFFKDLLRPMENNIRTQYQVEQLENLENKLKLDEKKYGEIISIIKHLQSTPVNTINYKAQKLLDRMQKESAQSEADTKVIPSEPVQPSNTDQTSDSHQTSNSGAAITIFNFKLQLVLVGFATCFTTQMIRMLEKLL